MAEPENPDRASQNPFQNLPPRGLYEDVAKKTKETADIFEKETDSDAKKAGENTHGVYEGVHGTDNTELNPFNAANNARGEGRFGMFNDRDYRTTLRLARRADAYNNKPVAHHIVQDSLYGSGNTDMGVPYERPKIETMETRAMEQARQLDTNQKQLEQQLQAAVNRKDLDAFIDAYKQMYGIELDRYKATVAMRDYERRQEIAQVLLKDREYFMQFFTRSFNADTAVALFNLARNGGEDSDLSNLLGFCLMNGAVMPNDIDRIVNAYLGEYNKQMIAEGVPKEERAIRLNAERNRVSRSVVDKNVQNIDKNTSIYKNNKVR